MKGFVKFTLLCIFSLNIFLSTFTLAKETTPYLLIDTLAPLPTEATQKAQTDGYNPLWTSYSVSSYQLEQQMISKSNLDFEHIITNAIHYLVHQINNLGWQTLLVWNFTVLRLVMSAFSLDFIEPLAHIVENAVRTLSGYESGYYRQGSLWGSLLMTIIILAGVWFIYYGMLKQRLLLALGAMMKLIAILILGTAYFSHAGPILLTMNEASRFVGQEIMAIDLLLDKKQQSFKKSSYVISMMASDQLYRILVYEPYVILQHGTLDMTNNKQRIHNILDSPITSEIRQAYIEDEKQLYGNMMVTEAGTFQRLLLIGILMFTHGILGLLFLCMAGMILIYQVLFLLIALFAPLVLLAALYPSLANVSVAWMRKLLEFQVLKLLAGVFFSVLLIFSRLLYDFKIVKQFGYIGMLFLQLILIVGVIWKRATLLSIFNIQTKTKFSLNLSQMKELLDNLVNKVKQIRSYQNNDREGE